MPSASRKAPGGHRLPRRRRDAARRPSARSAEHVDEVVVRVREPGTRRGGVVAQSVRRAKRHLSHLVFAARCVVGGEVGGRTERRRNLTLGRRRRRERSIDGRSSGREELGGPSTGSVVGGSSDSVARPRLVVVDGCRARSRSAAAADEQTDQQREGDGAADGCSISRRL